MIRHDFLHLNHRHRQQETVYTKIVTLVVNMSIKQFTYLCKCHKTTINNNQIHMLLLCIFKVILWSQKRIKLFASVTLNYRQPMVDG